MQTFLTDTRSDCCCPEMRCCTPETVVVTVAGMSGQTIRGAVSYGDLSTIQRAVELICAPGHPPFVHSAFDVFVLLGKPTSFNPSVLQSLATCFGDRWTWWEDTLNPWPPSVFPPVSAAGVLSWEDPYDGPMEQLIAFQYLYDAGSNGYTVDSGSELRWTNKNNALCEASALLCTRPTPDGLHSGPCAGNGLSPATLTNENDLNGTYICHRPDTYVRPEIRCRINRQVPRDPAIAPGVTEAVLLYDVAPRRTWVYRPERPYECWDVLFPPDNDWYCIDYRCGKRNPWYSTHGFGICERGKCTVTAQGMTKPHLYPYHVQTRTGQPRNQSADLRMRLVPRDYSSELHGRFPVWWKVGTVDIADGGSGYEVGEFFEVDYDYSRTLFGGEIMTVFPYYEICGGLPYRPTWIDKYGYTGTEVPQDDGTTAAKLFQRLRISEVDENGGIVSVEVVPIYKHPDYSDGTCMHEYNPPREYFVGYGRLLCHPTSVLFGGRGYTVGDSIEFYCEDGCEEITPAIATVVDVDEKGSILDWQIRGSDFFRYVIEDFCNPNDTATGCVPVCAAMEGEPDERGKYRWKAKVLCDLTWHGEGVPARAASLPSVALANKVSDADIPWTHEVANLSGLTTITPRISRHNCETAVEIVVNVWPYGLLSESSDKAVRVLYLFPPYPACHGGGAAIKPLFGSWGANESDFGSSLVGASVIAGGAGYCYREKHHVEPDLPLDVPAIGQGSGARLSGFTFSSVNNYPNPAAAYGDNAPAATRFSYFPVTAATIDPLHRGTGYDVGQTFEVMPVGGRAVSDLWAVTGGDTPESCPNGAWYDGERAVVNAAGYFSIAFDPVTGHYLEAVEQRHPTCTLRIADVNQDGGITELEVVNGGMMFKAVYDAGKRNPDAILWLSSTLGYGADVAGTFQTNAEAERFGSLVSVSVVTPAAGDPKHPGQSMPSGGRDYANRDAGYFWMLDDLAVGGPVCPEWRLLAHLGWAGRTLVGGGSGDPTGATTPQARNPQPNAEPVVPRNFLHELYSTHDVVDGSMPSFVPRSTTCVFTDCYHDLLTRTYPLVKVWGGSCLQNGVDGIGGPLAPVSAGSYAVLRRKGKTSETAQGSDYVVVEWGPTVSFSYTPSSPCPGVHDGTFQPTE